LQVGFSLSGARITMSAVEKLYRIIRRRTEICSGMAFTLDRCPIQTNALQSTRQMSGLDT
jgi:hypothetical protein